MKSKIFKNMKHANIECPKCNWKRKQRKKQEKHYMNHHTSCYIKFPELPLTVLDESRAEYNCTNCGCVFPFKKKIIPPFFFKKDRNVGSSFFFKLHEFLVSNIKS